MSITNLGCFIKLLLLRLYGLAILLLNRVGLLGGECSLFELECLGIYDVAVARDVGLTALVVNGLIAKCYVVSFGVFDALAVYRRRIVDEAPIKSVELSVPMIVLEGAVIW